MSYYVSRLRDLRNSDWVTFLFHKPRNSLMSVFLNFKIFSLPWMFPLGNTKRLSSYHQSCPFYLEHLTEMLSLNNKACSLVAFAVACQITTTCLKIRCPSFHLCVLDHQISCTGLRILNSPMANAMRNRERLQFIPYIYHSMAGYHFYAIFVQFWSEGLHNLGKGIHIKKSISPSCY